ncbi:Putative cytosolic protein [Flavobacterium psychrophilum]|nr:Putative cytosolic protein [Flavobacterium psychrophilum]
MQNLEMIYICKMENNKSKDPLHGITLQQILEKLIGFYGFDTLGELISIKCFRENPTIKSSLTFLRKTDWARKKVEELYVKTLPKF